MGFKIEAYFWFFK